MKAVLYFLLLIQFGVCNAQAPVNARLTPPSFADTVLVELKQTACRGEADNFFKMLTLGNAGSGSYLAPTNAKLFLNKNLINIFFKSEDEYQTRSTMYVLRTFNQCELFGERVKAAGKSCKETLNSKQFEGLTVWTDANGSITLRNPQGSTIAFLLSTPDSCAIVEVMNGASNESALFPKPINQCSKFESEIRGLTIASGMEFPVVGMDSSYIKAGVIAQKKRNANEIMSYVVAKNRQNLCDVAIRQTQFWAGRCEDIKDPEDFMWNPKGYTNQILRGGSRTEHKVEITKDQVSPTSCLVSSNRIFFNQ